MPTSVGTLTPISSGLKSSWTMRTFGLNRGGRPKCSIQFRRAPMRNTRSAFWRTNERAAAADWSCVSGMRPFAIGIAR